MTERLEGTAADPTLVIKLGYRGGGFSGFAAQENQPQLRTVAGELERALETILRRPVELTCAGRTDAGVHALSQHVSLPVTPEEAETLTGRRLMGALTALTPEDISIRGLYRAAPGFSARFDALSRTYRYRIACGPQPVLAWGHAWWLRSELDVDAMDAAAQALLGERDFKSFCKTASAQDKPTCRNVTRCHVSRANEAGEDLVAVDIQANAFLHNMVRAIVGTLVEVGRGLRPVDGMAQILAARDRRAAGPTAPAKGLTFVDVAYPDGALSPW